MSMMSISQNEMIFLIVGLVSMVCFLWVFMKHPIHILFLFARGIFFILLLYAIQLLGLRLGWEHVVAVNMVTALISGFLGVPGILLLYGIHFIL